MGNTSRQVKTTEMVSKDFLLVYVFFTGAYLILLILIKVPFIVCHNTFYFVIIAPIFV